MIFRKYPDKFWNMIAARYAASPIDDLPAYQAKIQKIKNYLKPNFQVLDIGCGTGTQCFDLAPHVKQLTGIDISSKLLAIAEQRKAEREIENVTLLNMSLTDAEFEPESFDVIMVFYVMHFCEDVEGVLKRLHDWLKPGGLLIAESACLGETKLLGKALRFAGYLGLLPLINLLTYQQLEQTLVNARFELVEKTKFSGKEDSEYTLVARKK